MKTNPCIPLCLPALLACACASANAMDYDLWQGSSPVLATGATFATAFDTTLLFATGSQRIDSARLTLNFIGTRQLIAGEPTSAQTANSNGYTAYDYFSNYSDSPDVAAMLLDGRTLGANPVTAASPRYQTDTVTRTSPVGYWTESCNITGCQSFYHQIGTDRFIDRVAGYGGAFGYTTTLDAAQLALFGNAGSFRYGFTVADGGAQLMSAELMFSTSPVPEPGMPWVMAAGLVTLVARRLSVRAGRGGQRNV